MDERRAVDLEMEEDEDEKWEKQSEICKCED
jgi:hypothetical protein